MSFKVSRDDQFAMPPFTPEQLEKIFFHFDPSDVQDIGGSVIIRHAEYEAHYPPLLVGGKLAVFCSPTDEIPFGCAINVANRAGPANDDIGNIGEELESGEFPSRASFEALFRAIPDAGAISYFNGIFTIEFSCWAAAAQHRTRCRRLPSSISRCPVSALNGKVKMSSSPNFNLYKDSESDHSLMDLSHYDTLYPGAMVTTRGRRLMGPTAAGVLVRYKKSFRLTISCQGLVDDDEALTVQEVRHPSISGNLIGRISNRIPDTAIALSSLGSPGLFHNNPYFNFPADLTKLLPSTKLRPGQVVGIDTFVKGFEQMITAGIRAARIRQPHTAQRASKEIPDEIKYQGMFATNSRTMQERSNLRANRCGAPVAIISDENDQSNIGGIVGLARFATIPGYARSIVCYADCLDSMIDGGWRLVLPGVAMPASRIS